MGIRETWLKRPGHIQGDRSELLDFTLYSLDMTIVLYTTNTAKGKFLMVMESVNILWYGNVVGINHRFNRGL